MKDLIKEKVAALKKRIADFRAKYPQYNQSASIKMPTIQPAVLVQKKVAAPIITDWDAINANIAKNDAMEAKAAEMDALKAKLQGK